MVDPGHEGKRSLSASFDNSRAAVQISPGDGVHWVIQQTIEVQLFPMRMKDVELPMAADGC